MAKRSSFVESFNCAIEGLIYVIKTQRNMRVHLLLAIFALICGVVLRLDGIDFLFVCLAITLVLWSEMMNTGVELQIDLISETYHPLAKIVKDIFAGAVLLASTFAVLVAYLILAKKFDIPVQIGISRIQASPWNISFICLTIVLVVAILMKILLQRGTPFYGGMPSVHAAVAFGIWILVTLLSASTIIAILSLVVALMVAQNRVTMGAHNYKEVAVGALLGSLLSLTLYQLISQW